MLILLTLLSLFYIMKANWAETIVFPIPGNKRKGATDGDGILYI